MEDKIAQLPCPCGSGTKFGECCKPFLTGKAYPQTAEALMRSRFTAYVARNADYIYETTHPDTRTRQLEDELRYSIHRPDWVGLRIVSVDRGLENDKQGKVKFVARYNENGQPMVIKEHSRFKRHEGKWKYYDNCG